MTHLLEVDGSVLHESSYTVEGENIRVKQELLDGQVLILYTLDHEQTLTRYELYKTRKTAPEASLLWTYVLGVNIEPAQGKMLLGNLPQYQQGV